MLMKTAIHCLALILLSLNMSAQVEESSELYKTIMKNDSLVFDVGFNQCRLDIHEDIMTEDLEFYHDKGGASYSRAANIRTMKEGLCKTGVNRYIRVLDHEETEIFPLFDNNILYGAIQHGVHGFYFHKDGAIGSLDGDAAFTHLWLLIDGDWKLKRVLSYDH